MSLIGILVALLGFLYAADVFGEWLLFGNPVQGWSPLMMAVLFLGGLQLLTIGVSGEYLWRVLAQVRGRQLYIIDAVFSDEIAGNQGASAI
jgi:dolichol-phosphate mannosyltransferase